MIEGDGDPLAGLRGRLQDLFVRVRRPTYRSLEAHADLEGWTLRPSTVSGLLNGPGTPRWDTVETFVRTCARYARTHQIPLAPELVDLDRWHADYRAAENALADQAARREQVAGRPVPARRRRLAVPAQLPSEVPAFTGRTDQLSELDKRLPDERREPDGPATVVISAIDGTAGVGKTALAVHWAHRVADRFPDGQLYVNLRGFDPGGQAMDPATAVRGFLDALEVPQRRIPEDPDAQVALYRSLLSGKRMLVVLDNARDTGQVRPLLPGTRSCMVVITSRNQLTSLIATHGAHPIRLDVLSVDEARNLLAQRIGAERVAAEPDAVDGIIDRCARLPLALGLVAAHAAVRPDDRLHVLAEELRDVSRRWLTLTGDDPSTDVRAVFSWSYHCVSPAAARLFRLIGLHPGPDLTAPAAASLAAVPVAQVRPLLAELTRSSLLTERTPGRYTLHDLLWAYAAELTRSTDGDADRHAARHRLFDHYLHTMYAGDRLLAPTREELSLAPAQPGVFPEQLVDHRQALDWFAAERPVLLAAVDQALATGFLLHTWQLTRTVSTYLQRQGHLQDQLTATRAAAAAAERLTDLPQARIHRSLGATYTQLGRYDDARAQLVLALDRYLRDGDRTGQAHTHARLSELADVQGDQFRALDHARQALDLYRAAGDRAGEADALNVIGYTASLTGDHRAALDPCEQALVLYQELADPHGQAATWDSLGHAHHHLGHRTEATACFQRSIEILRDLGDRSREAHALTHLGDSHRDNGDSAAARDAYRQALAILTELDRPEADAVRAKLAAL